MSTANPLPRQTRQAILTATAAQAVFGPFDFILFNADDVEVRVRVPPATTWTLLAPDQVTAAPAVPFSTLPSPFKVTLATPRSAGDQVWIKGKRLAQRTTDVTRGGALQSQALETELDREVATEQELRRDVDALVAGGATGELIASGVANDSTAPGGSVADALSALDARVVANEGEPFFVLCTGQSNFEVSPAFAWEPAVNVKVWNNAIGVAGSVGNAFVPPPSNTVNLPASLASHIGIEFSNRQIYLLNVSIGSQPISQWMTGAAAPDVYADIQANITAALAAAGVSKIDLFAWWQGEANANLPLYLSYIADHATVMNRFWSNSWFPRETPVLIHGLASSAITTFQISDVFNAFLMAIVNADADNRRFVNTSALPSTGYWDTVTVGHMTGQGYFSAGAMAASAFLHGTGRSTLQGIVVDLISSHVAVGNAKSTGALMSVSSNASLVMPAVPAGTVLQTAAPDGTGNLSIMEGFASFTQYTGRRANGTMVAPTALLVDDLIVSYGAHGNQTGGAAGYSLNQASLQFYAGENWSAGHAGTYALMTLTPAGSATNAAYFGFLPGMLTINSTGGGSIKSRAPATGVGDITWPAGTTDFTATGGAGRYVKQLSAGGALTVTQPLFSEFGGVGTGVVTALGINVGTAGSVVVNGGALGTPSSGVATNLTGTAAGLTAGNVTTNANLTGDVTSVGNATTIGANKVTRAMQAQGVARSVIGVTGNATANVADIQGTASQFLGVNSAGTALAFQTMSSDATLSGGAITVTGINGVNQNAAWTSYTPTVTSGSGTITTASATGRYKQVGKTIHLEVDITVTTAGTGSGLLNASLPFAAAAFNFTGSMKEAGLTGKSGAAYIAASGTVISAFDSTPATIIASGARAYYGITYEIP